MLTGGVVWAWGRLVSLVEVGDARRPYGATAGFHSPHDQTFIAVASLLNSAFVQVRYDCLHSGSALLMSANMACVQVGPDGVVVARRVVGGGLVGSGVGGLTVEPVG